MRPMRICTKCICRMACRRKKNCPDLKPVTVSTFGRVKFPNVAKTIRLLSAVSDSSLLSLFFSQLQSRGVVKIKCQCEWRTFLYSLLWNSSLWKIVIAWERSSAASAYGIIWGDAGQNKHGGILVRNVVAWILVVTARF